MENYFTALFDNKVKRQALVFASVFFTLDMVLYYTGKWYLNSHYHHSFFQYLVLLGLLIAVGSKDKNDDERSQLIRYGILKQTLGLVAVAFGVLILILSNFAIEKLSTLTILYIIEGTLVIHLILLFLANKYNPKWLFRERTAPDSFNKLIIAMFGVFYAMFVIIALVGYFLKL